MDDSYDEWLVKRRPPFYTYIARALLVTVCFFTIFLALILPFGVIILAIVLFVAYWLFQRMSTEFEYVVVNDEISLEVIFGKSKRKKGWEGTMDDVQIICPADYPDLKYYEVKDMKNLDYSSHMPGARVYAMVIKTERGVGKILFEPTDKMLQILRNRAPRKVII